MARRSGRIAAGLADRACKGIVVVIDDFEFGRKRGSVGTASAVFRVVSSSDDLAWTPAALPADSMRSPALP